MNFVRELVSQNKTRFKDEEFNLDLTYITPKIIAMSYPAKGFESLYRNRIEDVSSFIKKNHEKNFLVINLSNRTYDYIHFDNKVYDVKWPDHYPCPFLRYVETVIFSSEFLLTNDNNTLFVHCLAGKGRTGSLINSLLITTGKVSSISVANEYYYQKRCVKVDRNSQIAYLNYYKNFYDNGIKNMCFYPKRLSSITIVTKNDNFFTKDFSLKLEFVDFENDLVIYSTDVGIEFLNKSEKSEKLIWQKYVEKWETNQCVDILCNFIYKGNLGEKKYFRVNFNTYFFKNKHVLNFNNVDVSNKLLPQDFEMILKFEKIENEKMINFWENKFNKLYERIIEIKKKIQK
jgi:phosphatidylinositol-3,4,5-trisphosphate 3-phosphatase/dual-specificity protein phosphatase PTEN